MGLCMGTRNGENGGLAHGVNDLAVSVHNALLEKKSLSKEETAAVQDVRKRLEKLKALLSEEAQQSKSAGDLANQEIEIVAGGRAGAVGAVLNQLHEFAHCADGDRYLSLFSTDGVFLGTDAIERWPFAVFQNYVRGRFATGTGWTYHLVDRHVDFAPSATVAWFDELLRNETFGICRGSGVLRQVEGQWKIAQYHLTMPVPNDLLLNVAAQILAKES